MKPTTAQQQALLTLLNRIYSEIRIIEEAHHIQARPEDFRPRIDYFHDAVRALTNASGSGFERIGRLSVESLAHDVVMLRQIKENPRIAYPKLPVPLSARTDLAPLPPLPVSANASRVDVNTITALTEGYTHYALIFVALLSYAAERNYLNRLSEGNEQLDQVKDAIANAPQEDAASLLAGITDPELRQRLMATIGNKKRANTAEILAACKQEKEQITTRNAALEAAHMRYASSQLVLFQEGQKMVKKLAAQGLNVVGEFVEQAVREAERGGRSL